MTKIWFAEKNDGTILELTEKEALTHFENNNIAQRMRLRFLGTSDGSKFQEARQKVQQLMAEKRAEQYPDFGMMNAEERKYADYQIQASLRKEIRELLQEGRKAELEQAKANGVQRPDKSLRIITKSDGVDKTRDQIINSMNI